MIQKATATPAGQVDLRDKAEKLQTREDFVAFIQNLLADFRARPDDWENRNLDTYLEALAAWTENMDGYYRNQNEPIPTSPTWRTIAHMLLAARVYE